jgi:hypothetical protein
MTVNNPIRIYDVLKPVIQTKDEGVVEESQTAAEAPAIGPPYSIGHSGTTQKTADTLQSLQAYAKHLMQATEGPMVPDHLSPSLSPDKSQRRNRVLSPSLPTRDLLEESPNGRTLAVPENTRGFRPRKGSLVSGDDDLSEEATGCGQAVEVLSRHSSKSKFATGS